MKKFLALILSLVMMLSVVALVACAETEEPNTEPVVETFTGEYKYTVAAWYTTYGCKVDVTLTDDVISAVKIYSDEETGYHNVSDENADYGWTEAAIANWTDNQEEFAASFVGMTADEVADIDASCDGSGAVVEGFDVVAGATQSCARVILAIQNAICDGVGEMTEVTGTAYGLVHTSYVGFASVVYQGNDVISVVLDEMCTPLWLSTTTYATYFEEGDAVDYTEFTSNTKYFTTFYIGTDVTFTYTTENDANTYVLADGTTLLEWLAVEANCETYYNAVIAGEVSAETGDTDLVLTASMLQKSLNGYWGTEQGKTEDFWLEYCAETCAYVVANDFAALWMDRLDDNTWVDSNGATTSATWKDMYDYVNLIRAAAGVEELGEVPEVPEPVTADGTYTGSANGGYGNSFDVSVVYADGAIVSVTILETSVTGTGGYDTTFDASSDTLLASFVGMTAAQVLEATTMSDFVAGATDSSSALLAAVADALTIKE